MSDLTDLEIIKRVAEVVGFDFTLANNTIQAKPFTVTDVFQCNSMGFTFNPLTDDALCFRLMVKYQVDTIHEYHIKQALIYDDPEYDPIGKATDKNLNKAILLAIIKANKK